MRFSICKNIFFVISYAFSKAIHNKIPDPIRIMFMQGAQYAPRGSTFCRERSEFR